MHLYQLEVTPDPTAGEGEDWSRWFASLRAARVERARLIHADKRAGRDGGSDYRILRFELATLSPKRLVLAALNRRGLMRRFEVAVPAYAFHPENLPRSWQEENATRDEPDGECPYCGCPIPALDIEATGGRCPECNANLREDGQP